MSRTPHSLGSSTLRARDLYIGAAVLPVVPGVASCVAALGPGAWASLTPSLVRAVTPDALLYSAVSVVVAAPLAGVALASGGRGRASDVALRLTVACVIFCTVSAALTLTRLGLDAGTLRFTATSHAVLASATVALAALGAFAGTLFRDALDAAAVSITLALAAAYGVLVGGAPVGEMSASMLKAAVLASPVMTVASVAQVDLVRSDIWYQVSPLAHTRLEYPAWGVVSVSYLLAACTAFLALARRPAVSATEQEL